MELNWFFTIRVEYCNFLNSVWVVFNNFFLIDATDRSKLVAIDATDRSKISSDHHRIFFANTPFKKWFSKKIQLETKRIFKWPSTRRWQCPIYNGTLNTLIQTKMCEKHRFVTRKVSILVSFSIAFNKEKYASHFRREIANEKEQFKSGIAIFAWRVTWNYA